MNRLQGAVTMNGQPVTLLGTPVRVGDVAPHFIAFDSDMSPVPFSSFRGRPCLVSSVVSLDTPVCNTEIRRFNAEAAHLDPAAQVLVLSMDLPFALKRWCGAAGVDRVLALSDHRDASFGTRYGVLIRQMRLLARAVFVVDTNGRVVYTDLVSEVTDEPDYEEALAAMRSLV